MPVILEVTDGPHAGQKFEFDRHAAFIVGRSPEAACAMVKDLFLSRFHFLIEYQSPTCFLRDMGSRNGTKVNGELAGEILLNNEDRIEAGNSQFIIRLDKNDLKAWRIRCADCGEVAPAEVGVSDDQSESMMEWLCKACADKRRKFPAPPPDYVYESLIGAGGMGEVYKARHRPTGNLAAIKCVIPAIAASQKARDYFRREMSVLRDLQHPNIVHFRGIFEHRGQFQLIMEYVDGVDAMRWLKRLEGTAPIATACWIGVKLMEGLAHAHEKGYVHRDVKPSNVLIAQGESESRPLVKLTDFGLAKNFRENARFTGLTRQGDIGGSIGFIAPEHIHNFRMVKESADIYSAACTIYFLLTGDYPILDFDPRRPDAYVMVLEHPVVPLRVRRPDAPEGLEAALRKAMRKQPERRWATAQEFADAMRPWIDG